MKYYQLRNIFLKLGITNDLKQSDTWKIKLTITTNNNNYPNWIKNTKATINSITKKENNCF